MDQKQVTESWLTLTGKIIGVVAGFVGIVAGIGGIMLWLIGVQIDPLLTPLKVGQQEIKREISSIKTNHLPHIKEKLEERTEDIEEMDKKITKLQEELTAGFAKINNT